MGYGAAISFEPLTLQKYLFECFLLCFAGLPVSAACRLALFLTRRLPEKDLYVMEVEGFLCRGVVRFGLLFLIL